MPPHIDELEFQILWSPISKDCAHNFLIIMTSTMVCEIMISGDNKNREISLASSTVGMHLRHVGIDESHLSPVPHSITLLPIGGSLDLFKITNV